MNYEEFGKEVIRRLKEDLPDYEIHTDTVYHENDISMTSITAFAPGFESGPTVCLELFFDPQSEQPSVSDAVEQLKRSVTSTGIQATNVAANIYNRAYLEHNVRMCVLSADKNRRYLADKPHREIEDLSICYYVPVALSLIDISSTVFLTDAIAQNMGMDEQELYAAAFKNMKYGSPYIMPMETVLKGIGDIPKNILPMVVVSNAERNLGAAIILLPSVQEQVANIIGKDFIVLPSSVHEVIAIPKDPEMSPYDVRSLKNIVMDINREQLDAQDVLSDNVYEVSGGIFKQLKVDDPHPAPTRARYISGPKM